MVGFNTGPIPWLAMDRYCEVHEIAGDQRDDFMYYVQHLDKTYLTWASKEKK